MQDAIARVATLLAGGVPDRAPIFELLRNDAVIAHFAGEPLSFANAKRLVYAAYAPAVDATRPRVRIPAPESTGRLPDGREQRFYRWTSWTQHREYRDADAYAEAKRAVLDGPDPAAWTEPRQAALAAWLQEIAAEQARLGEVFFFPSLAGPGLMGTYGEVGLEAFSYFLADCPDVIAALLEHQTVQAIALAEHLPAGHGLTAGFLGDDIAFKTGPMLSPAWMRAQYFPRLARVLAAWHRQGIKVLFHSDGNLNPILDDLVAAGIDGLNPIEVLAGMDVGEIHRRHPHLFLAGGIDVSQLLPFGTPAAVKEAVARAIAAAGGRIMIGSSTELHEAVPLANFLALREAVLEHRY